MRRWLRELLWGTAIALIFVLGPHSFSPNDVENTWIRFAIRFAAVSSLGLGAGLMSSGCTKLSKLVVGVAAFGLSVSALRATTWILDAGPHNDEPLPWNNVFLPGADTWLSVMGTVALGSLLPISRNWIVRMLQYGALYSIWNLTQAFVVMKSMSAKEMSTAMPMVGFLSTAIETRSPNILMMCFVPLIAAQYWAPILAANVPWSQSEPREKTRAA